MVVLLLMSVSHLCGSWDAAEKLKLTPWEGDVLILLMLSSEIFSVLGMRTLKHGGFDTGTKTKELFMPFGG